MNKLLLLVAVPLLSALPETANSQPRGGMQSRRSMPDPGRGSAQRARSFSGTAARAPQMASRPSTAAPSYSGRTYKPTGVRPDVKPGVRPGGDFAPPSKPDVAKPVIPDRPGRPDKFPSRPNVRPDYDIDIDRDYYVYSPRYGSRYGYGSGYDPYYNYYGYGYAPYDYYDTSYYDYGYDYGYPSYSYSGYAYSPYSYSPDTYSSRYVNYTSPYTYSSSYTYPSATTSYVSSYDQPTVQRTWRPTATYSRGQQLEK